jgi:hypothetical protein
MFHPVAAVHPRSIQQFNTLHVASVRVYDSPLPYMTAQLWGLAILALGAGESKREALL